jgi:hypothetical protein
MTVSEILAMIDQQLVEAEIKLEDLYDGSTLSKQEILGGIDALERVRDMISRAAAEDTSETILEVG